MKLINNTIICRTMGIPYDASYNSGWRVCDNDLAHHYLRSALQSETNARLSASGMASQTVKHRTEPEGTLEPDRSQRLSD